MEVCIGRVLRTKGLKGHIVVYFFVDKLKCEVGDILYLERQNNRFGPYKVESLSLYKLSEDKKYYTLKFLEVNSIDEASLLKNFFLIKQLNTLPEDVYVKSDLLNSQVIFANGKEIGKVIDIIRVKTNYTLLLVSNASTKEEFLVPFIKQVITKVDILNKKIILSEIDSIIPENL